ncbi:PadR family transcriptional regulator [Ottowia sp.]|jgi:DNA-binding PadR family transcriptional regulator|uniref:PadR family transcriptional regulator n=1 Tax=Ottowia sp. TaxID=1898956 RepID=UPI0025CD3E69|nr:PadR family transcriptional regulator [Ottowia sp.]MBK6615150.1 PadR family transcriptional regulator [Ottowia sp.]MBK6746228.1 PadR family transcriptional regulator [Ottowia sp.]
MSLPHALLTALIEHPCSGSELAERFDRSIGYFWHATHQQIYRELARLEEAGWIEALAEEAGRGRKRQYRILAAGRKELRRWVAEPEDPKPLREELMVRLRAAAVIGPSGLQDEITRRVAMHRDKLDLYRRIEQRDFLDQPPSRERRLQHLVLRAGILQEELWLQLSQEALEILASSDADDRPEASAEAGAPGRQRRPAARGS